MTPPLPADRKPHIEIVLVSSLKLSQKAWWHSKLWHQPHIENLDMNRGKRCMQRNRDKWCTQRSKFVLLQTQLSNYVMHVLYVLTLKAAVKHALMHCQQSADAAPLPIEAMYGLAALCLLRTQVDHTCREHMQRSHTENTCNTHAIHMQYTCNTHAIHTCGACHAQFTWEYWHQGAYSTTRVSLSRLPSIISCSCCLLTASTLLS